MVVSSNPALPEDSAPKTLLDPILVVSTDHRGRSMIKRQLEQAGYQVQESTSAEEALKAATQCPPKLILVDTGNPGMDGQALMQRLRGNANLTAIPIIHLISIEEIALREQSLKAGANDFVLKPLAKTELLHRVHTWIELQRSREELRVERAKTELICASSRELSAELDLNVLLSRMLELVRTSIGALGGSVILLDEQGHPFRHIFSHRGEVTSIRDEVWDKVVQDGLAGWVIRQRQGTIVHHTWQDSRWVVGGYQLVETRSALAVPLIPEGRVVGVLTLTHEQAAYFTPAHLDLVLSIAYQAAVVIDKAYAYHKAKLRARQLRLINEVSRQISSILDPEPLLQDVARLICQAFEYDYVQVALIAGVELILQHWNCERQQRSHNTPKRLSLYDQGVIPWVARQGQSLLVPDVQQEPRYRLVEERPDANSELAVPLKAGDEVLGVLDIQCSYPNQLTEADVTMLEILAAQVSIALSNARFFAAIKHERSQLEAILTGTSEAIIVTDENLHITLLNPAAERIFGVPFNESVGQPLDEILPYASLEKAFGQIRQESNPHIPNELSLPNGRTFSINVSSITDPDGGYLLPQRARSYEE
jgi:PAS domain S-box-containing protein